MPWDNDHKRQSELPRDWHIIRRDVLKRDGYACQIAGPRCTKRATDVDHIGDRMSHERFNLRAACHQCHVERTVRQSHDAARINRARAVHPREKHPGLS